MFSAWADSSAHMASTLWDLVLHVQSTVYLWTQTSPCVRSPLPLIAHNWFSININRRQTLGHASPANLHLSLPRCSRIVGTDCEAGILVFGKLPKWNGNGIGNDVAADGPLWDLSRRCSQVTWSPPCKVYLYLETQHSLAAVRRKCTHIELGFIVHMQQISPAAEQYLPPAAEGSHFSLASCLISDPPLGPLS